MKLISIIIVSVFLLDFSGAYAQELKSISPKSYIAENPSTEREAIVDFITKQFSNNMSSGIIQEEIDNTLVKLKTFKNLHIARFQIIDQKIYADLINSDDITRDRFIEIILYLQKITNKYKINDVDFLIYLSDSAANLSGLDSELDFPVFAMSKNIDCSFEKNIYLFPDLYMIMDAWNDLTSKIEQAKIVHPWDKKDSKIFWRGASTGPKHLNINNFDKLPRLSLVIQSKLYPDLIDASFSNFVQFSDDQSAEDIKKLLNLLFEGGSQSVSEEEHLRYKYLISVDGNTAAWKRVPWIMLSNSVLVKQETGNIEWFYPAIKPYVHYVPVDKRLTDIFSQIAWMRTHDKEIKQISQNAQNFVRNNLKPWHIEAHVVLILNAYNKLYKNKKIIATIPSADKTLKRLKDLKEAEAKKTMGTKKRLKKFFRKLKEKIKNLWT